MRILAAGEALIDWVSRERGLGLDEAAVFTRAPGGAPLNVAVGLARLGAAVGFAGCLADDPFGDGLLALLRAEGVDVSRVRRVAGRQTRMAYVVTDSGGDRQLAAFARAACADAELAARDLAVDGLDALYFGSLPLMSPGPREALVAVAARVREAGGLVWFDPNVRPVLWPDADELDRTLKAVLDLAHVAKLSGEELLALTGTEDLRAGADRLLAAHPLTAVVVTWGERGAGVRVRDGACVAMPAFPVAVADTLGAGDGFVAGMLATLLEAGEPLPGLIARMDEDAWRGALRRASGVGALVTTKVGAIAALPTRDALEAFLT